MNPKMTKEEYKKYVDKKSPNSPILKNTIKAFLGGGLICAIGQMFLNFYKSKGLGMENSFGLVSITLIFIGALLTGFNLYDKIGKHLGAGALVPITGFSNSIVSPAMEFKSEGFVLGVGAKMFVIAGPVLVYGITSSVIAGLIYYFIR
ncbi:MAG: stage V sporulation protein AC [Clostridiaceae bacterium]|nr:stage V sporulation protein AC [Clostridiaceae bacterium]